MHSARRYVASICQTSNYNQIASYFVAMLRLHYFYDNYEVALDYADRARAVLPAFQGQVAEWEFVFYAALASAACASGMNGDAAPHTRDRSTLLETVDDLLGRFEVWADTGPATFAHKRDLIRAERLNVRGERVQAAAAYATAVDSAAASGFVQDHALAHERTALFHRAGDGDATKAAEHLDHAIALYRQWEAWGKPTPSCGAPRADQKVASAVTTRRESIDRRILSCPSLHTPFPPQAQFGSTLTDKESRMQPKGHRLFRVIYCLAAACWIVGCQPSQPSQSATSAAAPSPASPSSPPAAPERAATSKSPTDLEQLANRIVTQSAAIKEGEVVLVSGGAQDQELLENIAVNVRRVGAFPLVTLNSDRLTKRLFFDVPDKFDAQQDVLGMKLAENVDAAIFVDYSQDETAFADADPKRRAARAKASQPVIDTFIKRKVRQIAVGNGMYPAAWRAKRFGMSDDQLAKTFWEGVNVDYGDLASRADQVKKVLAAGREIHLKDANGSDLRVRIEGRPVFASDGMITADEVKQGGAAVNVYLPAGEVYVAPVAGTAEGKVVRAKEYFEGKEIDNLTLTFAAGKLTSITGSGPGFEPFKAFYDAAGAGKEMFAIVDLGINPRVQLPASASVGTWVPAGTITVGFGNNVWAGGSNNAPFGYYVSLPGTTVTLDDKVIIENGRLTI